jgi:hypothetical protein
MKSENDNIKTNITEINPILEGKFRHLVKYFCCCSKLIYLNFVLTKNDLLFYLDEFQKKLYLSIPTKSVIAINKRQIDKKDIFMISIFYENNFNSKITEFKIKATSRVDTDRWLSSLRREIKTKKYEFQYDKNKYEEGDLIFPFQDTRKFYLSICHLEYIIASRKMEEFFQYYYNKKNENKKNSENDNLLNNENGIAMGDIAINID